MTQRLLEGVFLALLVTMPSNELDQRQVVPVAPSRCPAAQILTEGVQSEERAIAGGKVGDQSHSIGITDATPALLEAKALSEVIRRGHTSSHV